MCSLEEPFLWGESLSTVCYSIIVTSIAVIFIQHMSFFQKYIEDKLQEKSKKEADPKVYQLLSEIRQLQSELDKISPTSEFAAYFKKERILNKAKEHLETLQKQEADPLNSQKLKLASKSICQAIGFSALYYVSGYQVFCIPSSLFWPFNILLRVPFANGAACDSCDYDAVPVLLFNLLFIFFATVRKFL